MNLFRTEYNQEYFENVLYLDSIESPRNQSRLDLILSHKRIGSLLEIGFGKGKFLKLAQRYFHVTGIDVSDYALETTDTSLRQFVRHFDIEGDQPLDDQYDVIAAFNVLEHLVKPNKAVKRVFQALQKNGLFTGSVPCNTGLFGRFHTALTNLFDRTHISTYPPHRWCALFHNVGFRKIEFFGEVMLGGNNSLYINGNLWKYISFNLMFTCQR